MRDGFIEELKALVSNLEQREADVSECEKRLISDQAALNIFQEGLVKRADDLERREKEAENTLKATSSIRQELALRKARIVTLEQEAQTREAKLAKAREEKGSLQAQVTALKKIVAAISADPELEPAVSAENEI